MYTGATKIDDEERQSVYKVLDTLNTFLNCNKYLIGSEEPTLADVITFVSVTNVTVCVDSGENHTLSLQEIEHLVRKINAFSFFFFCRNWAMTWANSQISPLGLNVVKYYHQQMKILPEPKWWKKELEELWKIIYNFFGRDHLFGRCIDEYESVQIQFTSTCPCIFWYNFFNVCFTRNTVICCHHWIHGSIHNFKSTFFRLQINI